MGGMRWPHGTERIVVRQARADDLQALAELRGREVQFYAERLHRQDQGLGVLIVAVSSGMRRHQRYFGGAYLWLEPAEEADLRRWLPGVPLLQDLFVRPQYRNQWIGTRLVTFAEARAHEAGRTQLALGVLPGNQRAKRFYSRRGFREWAHGTITTTRHTWLANGQSERTDEECEIFVKDL